MQQRNVFLVLLLMLPFFGFAQVDPQINNPYSAYGIGQLQDFATVRNQGMGGTGIAVDNNKYLNFMNPALLSRARIVHHTVEHNESISTIAKTYGVAEDEIRSLNEIVDEAVEGQVIKIPFRKYTMYEANISYAYSKFSGAGKSYSDNYFGFRYFAFAFPISQRLTLSTGLIPYSRSGLISDQKTTTSQGTTNTTDRRDGGLNQLFLSGGADVTKNFSLGVQGGFVFGNLKSEHFFQSQADTIDGYISTDVYKGFAVKPGMFYRTKLTKSGSEDSVVYLNTGLTFEYLPDFNVKNESNLQTRNIYNGLLYDTVLGTVKRTVTLPYTLAFGIGIHKMNQWLIAADLQYSNWSNAKGFDALTKLTDSYKASLGAEWKMYSRKDRGNLKKPVLRAGVAIQNLPYKVDGENVQDLSASIGLSKPLGKINMTDKHQPLPTINFAVTGGTIGKNSLSTGKQLYIKGSIGILINDKWFKRRRIQ